MINDDTQLLQESTVNCRPQQQQSTIDTILIYCSSYYPYTKQLLQSVIQILIPIKLPLLCSSIDNLSKQLFKEIYYGPSNSYISPQQFASNYNKDIKNITCLSNNNNNNIQKQLKFQNMQQQLKQLKLIHLFPSLHNKQQLLWYNNNYKILQQQQLTNNIKKQLELSGQNWIQSIPYPGLLLTLKYICQQIISINNKEYYNNKFIHVVQLNLARINLTHNKILTHPVQSLCLSVLRNYRQYLTNVGNQTIMLEQWVDILLEYSHALLFYYKYEQSRRVLEKCGELLNVAVKYEGKLGRRTKYQSFDVAQLIMTIKNKNQLSKDKNYVQKEKQQIKNQKIKQITEIEDKNVMGYNKEKQEEQQWGKFPKPKNIISNIINKQIQKQNKILQSSTFDEQSILLDKPKLIEQITQFNSQQNNNNSSITNQKALFILSIINYQWQTIPHDEISYQNISSSINTLLNENNNNYSYCIQFAILSLRSFNQFPRCKNTDRSIQQLQKLKNYYNEINNKDTRYLWSTFSSTYLQFIKNLSDKYISIGLSMTAVNLMKQVGLIQECIDALIKRQYRQKALQMANERQSQGKCTPRLLCMFGDIHRDCSYYEKAWKLSQQKYARAQRSLAWTYFSQKKYEQAANSFTLATKASYYHANTWFTLGCCYLNMQNYQKALRPFGECICIDSTQGQCWGNLAACYMHLKKYKQAYSTLEQAVKYSQRNWKLWSNLLSISLTLKQFYKYFQCIEKIVALGHGQVITDQILSKVSQIFTYKLETEVRMRPKNIIKKRIDRLYDILCAKMGENPIVWKNYCHFQIIGRSYLQMLGSHFTKMHSEGTIDPNDPVDDYETLERTQQTTKKQTVQALLKIVEYKQNELNMQMKIGWQQNKIIGQKVKQSLQSYVEIYKKYGDKDKIKQIQIFIKGLCTKLSKCLQQEINLNL